MRTVIVESGQSIIDIAVQEFGTADGLKTLCDLNGLDYDQDLDPGMRLTLPDLDPDNRVQQYMHLKKFQVTSHIDEEDIGLLVTNEDEDIITNDNNLIAIYERKENLATS